MAATRTGSSAATGRNVIDVVRDYMRSHLDRRISLQELSELAGMCRFALARTFAREVGVPPHAYLNRLRVGRARELIAAGRRLSDVALEVGFTDQSHLTRHFKRQLGMTPGEWARQSRGAGRQHPVQPDRYAGPPLTSAPEVLA